MERYALEVSMDKASLRVKKGEIHAALAEKQLIHGLARLLGGLAPKQRYDVLIEGESMALSSPRSALDMGIAVIFCHSGMAEDMTVLDQLRLLPGMPRQKKKARQAIEEAARGAGLPVDLDARGADLTVGERYLAQLLRALLENKEFLILEQPDWALTPLEMENLLPLLRRNQQEGKSVLLLTSRPETARLADACTELTPKEQLLFMPPADPKEMAVGSVTLEARDLTYTEERRGRRVLRGASLEARAGEITAVVGVPGSGQEELAAALAGMLPLARGRVRLKGKEITSTSVRDRLRLGLGFAPGPKMNYGFSALSQAAENVCLRFLRDAAYRESGFLKHGEMRRFADDMLDSMNAYPANGAAAPADSLTAEEKQRCVLAREMERNPDALIALDPTLGLSKEAARDIWDRLIAFRNTRRAVLLITEDIREALALGGRILVLCRGEIVGEFEAGLIHERELSLYMTGERRQGREEQFDEE